MIYNITIRYSRHGTKVIRYYTTPSGDNIDFSDRWTRYVIGNNATLSIINDL